MNWFKKKIKNKAPEETGIDLPALNWFIHVLIKNVGYNKWVRMTKEEQERYDKEHPYNAGYPYKVVTDPIPPGKDIVLKESGTHTISCDSEYTRNLIIEMARAYDALERKYHYVLQDRQADEWHEVKELKPIPPHSSFRGPRLFLVSSPVLCYVCGGLTLGMEYEGKWYIFLEGTKIEHAVTHYRHLPPRPLFQLPDYELVKAEAERLRNERKKQNRIHEL